MLASVAGRRKIQACGVVNSLKVEASEHAGRTIDGTSFSQRMENTPPRRKRNPPAIEDGDSAEALEIQLTPSPLQAALGDTVQAPAAIADSKDKGTMLVFIDAPRL